ncbi:type II secretion system F family protein [Xanthomonas massiliensis]|uniref:type II secretion system F family protein n=1 Tax=Xanthomonas massiliensis TaxID=1720302 RepID=UPI000824E685|nr:type II secretion system F family protein [Xanthomonas massiliensis]
MSLVLALLSVVLLLLAAAVELWWGVSARQRQRAELERIEMRLPSSLAARPVAAASGGEAWRGQQGTATALPWDGLMRRAGLPAGWRTASILLALGLVLAVLATLRMGTPWIVPPVVLLYAALVALWLSRRIDRLRQKLLGQLPDFLDNMVRMTSVGNSLPMAFQGASAQVLAPLRPLLDTTLLYSRGGMELDQALLKASRPYRIEILEVLALVLGVSIRIGGRADQVLQRLANFMRDLQQAQHELRATTSETRASSWVLGLLPPGCVCFMALLSPDFFQPMFHDPLGLKLLGMALALEALGALLLYRLAKSI